MYISYSCIYSGIYLNMLVTKFITLYIQRTHFSCAHLLLLECAIKSKLIRVLLLLLYHIHIYWMCVCVLWFYSDQYIASHASTYYILNICYISIRSERWKLCQFDFCPLVAFSLPYTYELAIIIYCNKSNHQYRIQ